MSTDDRTRRGSHATVWLVACLLCWFAPSALAQVTHGPPRIRNVYIPADQLQLLFDNSSKGVLMPREKIMALWEEAQRHVSKEAAPPADAVLSQAAYEARLERHELRMTGRVRIAKLRDGWQAVDLPFGGLAIESARLNGQPARFGRKDDGALFLVLEKEGRFELELEMSAPLASKGGDLATTLKLPPAPASEILVRLQKGKQLQVGETTLQSESSDNDAQLFRVAVDRSGLTPLVISERFAGGDRASLILANSRSIGRIEPAGLRWEVVVDLDVYARATDTFRIHLPDSVDLAEVESPELAQWTVQKQAGGVAAVTLNFRKPQLGRRSVRLLGLASIPSAAQWDVPTVKVPEAASHVGQVSLSCSPSLRVEVGTLTGIRPERPSSTSANASPAMAGTPLAFAFWDENYRLPLRVTERRRTMQASIATLVEVNRTGVALRSSMTLQPRHAPVFNVEVLLPRAWEVTSVLAANQRVEWESAPRVSDGSAADASLQSVRFDLAKPLSPGQSLEIAISAQQHPEHWLEQDERYDELPLPDLRLTGADEVEGTLLIQGPPEIELSASSVSNDLQPMAADAARSSSAKTAGTVLQYRYQDNARISGRLQMRTKPAKVSAETLAFVRLDRGKLDVHYQLDLHIRQGTMRRIRFTLPAAVGEKIQIAPVDSPARVIEQRRRRLPDAGKADLYVWEIALDRPVAGNLTLALDVGQTCGATAPSHGAGESATGESVSAEANVRAAVPVLALQNISRQSGMVAVEAASDQQIDCQPESLRELDPADVLKPRAYTVNHRIVAAYQYRRLPYALSISATRHTPGAVLTAICESAEITSVAGSEGRMRHQAKFWLRSLNLPHVPVVLPEGANLWSVMLDNEPIEVRRKQGAYLVPLPTGQSRSDNSTRKLTLVYETDGPRSVAGSFWERLLPQSVRQVAPELGVATLGTTWRVYPPDGTDLVSAAGEFKPETPLTRPTLVSTLAATIAQQSTSSLPLKFTGLVMAGIFAGVFALARTGKGCGISLVQLLVVVTVLGVIVALLLPATQSAREAARRMTCTNQLKMIGLALHNYCQAYGRFPPAAIGPDNVPRERQFSWIVAILPFMEQDTLYKQLRLDLPWDHPLNAALLQVSLRSVLCPSDPTPTATSEGLSKTSYVAITGADSTDGSGNPRGIIGFDRGLRFDEIVDGTSNTILVAEVADGGPWFAGGAGTARSIDDLIAKKTWSHHSGVANVVFADGSVRSISMSTSAQTLRCLATAQAMDRITDKEFLADYGPAKAEVAASDVAPTARAAKSVSSIAKDEKVQRPAPTAAALPAEPPPEAPQQPLPAAGERARLSLGVTMDTYGGQEIRFRHEGGPGELVLGLQDGALANALQGLMVAAALLAAWIGRRIPGNWRAIAVVVGLTLPIGLAGVVPLAWTPLLDGLLLGALAAVCLWALLRFIASAKISLLNPAAAAAIGVSLWLASNASMAAETRPAEEKPAPSGEVRKPDLTLFIPYEPAREKPMNSAQAYLPHDEFLRLWKQAHPDKPVRAAPDVRAVVSHAEYSGRLQNDVARFDGRLVVDHLVDGWTPVALPLGKIALEKIEINGRPATLADDGRDQPTIYLDKSGPHVVDVRFSVSAGRLGATGQLTVPLRPVSSGRLVFQLPSADLDVEVIGSAGGWRRQRSASEGHDESVEIPLGAAKEISIRWQPRRAETRETHLISADQSLLAEVLDSGIYLHGKFSYRIQQGSVGKLRLRVPPEVAIQSVHGAEVADWSIETEPAAAPHTESQRLVVALKRELSSGTELDIHAFRRDRPTAGPIDIHALEPLDVVRETGRVAIACASHFAARVAKAEGLDQINRTGFDLPQQPGDGSALLWAYRYASRPWNLQLQVERHPSRVEVSDRTAVSVSARQTVFRSRMTVDVTGAPILALEMRLPASLRVSQVRVPSGADWFIRRDDQRQQLKIELGGPAVGKLDFEVSGTLVRDPGQADFAVPGVIVEAVQAQRGQLAIDLDDDLEAVLANGGGARPIDPATLQGELQADGNRPIRYAFQYDSPPKDLHLRLSSASSRVGGDVTTVVSVREGAVAYIGKVDFEIRQAGRSKFRIATPKWLGDDIELQGEQIRQIRSQLTGDRRTWEVELQQPVRGTYSLHLIQTLPLSDDGTVSAAIIRPLDVERSRSHIVLENATADEIAATTTRGVAPVSVAEVPGALTDNIRRQAVAAYRVADDAAALVWQRRVREQETGLIASISLCDLTTVIHDDGRYRARAAYNIRNFTLQFLELELPPSSEVWSVHVSGQPVHPAKITRQGRSVTLLPLEKTSIGDFSSKVVVIYSGDLGEPLHRWTQVRPPAPQILNNVPVSRTLWTVLLPNQYAVSLVKGESNLEEVAAEYQQEERNLSVLDELRQMVQVAGGKGKSAAQTQARNNLKQVGLALQDYARQGGQGEAKNAADVQVQAQQIQAEIGRLEELKTDANRADGETRFYFDQPRREPVAGPTSGDNLGHGREKLPEQRRGDMRKQAADQLEKLQVRDWRESGLPKKIAQQDPTVWPRTKPETTAAAGTGQLSLKLDVTPVGMAYHFRKLHGEPRLVLSARHDSLDRGLAAIVWAVLCLALAIAMVRGLRRTDSLARVRRYWPWLAAIAGTAWLFLLPVGVLGLILLVTALCVLIARLRKPEPVTVHK